jgi:hypothetical protein
VWTVNAQGLLAELFEARRARLQAVAYHMLRLLGRRRGRGRETWLRQSCRIAAAIR